MALIQRNTINPLVTKIPVVPPSVINKGAKTVPIPKPLSPGQSKPLTEKTITLTPPADPLALSMEEVALCVSGLLTLTALTRGLPWGLQWLGTPLFSGVLFGSSIYTTPTSYFGLFCAVTMAGLLTASQSKGSSVPFMNFFIHQSGAPPILRTLLQTSLTTRQVFRAVKGIQACVEHIGKKDTTVIAGTLFVHTVNLAAAGYNLLVSAAVSSGELSYYATWGLKRITSEQYAKDVMGSVCPNFFTPSPLPVYEVLPLSASPTCFERISFVWNRVSSPLYQIYDSLYAPLALCKSVQK